MTNMTKPILLVEDNPMDVDLTLRAFKRRHMANAIDIARDGQEALDFLAQWQSGEAPLPVVILLDLKLPKIDGLEVLRRFKSDANVRLIPVVVLTTSSEDSDVRMAYGLGANSYIVKPVDFEKFLDVATQIELYWGVLNKPAVE
jgi:CheY-like chemotaxis protein